MKVSSCKFSRMLLKKPKNVQTIFPMPKPIAETTKKPWLLINLISPRVGSRLFLNFVDALEPGAGREPKSDQMVTNRRNGV